MKSKLAGLAGLVLAIVLGTAVPAFAHVVVEPDAAAKGAEQTFVFRVPNEEDATATVKLEVKFPTDHPVTGVAVEPVPGWTAKVQTTTLATPIQTDDGPVTQVVSEITWSGGRIGSGQFQRFPWVGTLPDDAGVLVFPAIQTYANGDVVSWIQPIVAGQPEPEHPTPTVVVGATASGGAPATTVPAASATGTGTGSTTTVSAGSVSTAKTLGIVGLVAGLLGLALGAFALLRPSRPAT